MSFTPGPWGWFGNTDTKSIYLATRHHGRRFVMDFARYGMQGAQPRFNTTNGMWPASSMVRYEVCPEATSRHDERVYRADVAGIIHADARLIAAAPDLLEMLEIVEPTVEQFDSPVTHDHVRQVLRKARGEGE